MVNVCGVWNGDSHHHFQPLPSPLLLIINNPTIPTQTKITTHHYHPKTIHAILQTNNTIIPLQHIKHNNKQKQPSQTYPYHPSYPTQIDFRLIIIPSDLSSQSHYIHPHPSTQSHPLHPHPHHSSHPHPPPQHTP